MDSPLDAGAIRFAADQDSLIVKITKNSFGSTTSTRVLLEIVILWPVLLAHHW